MYKINTDDLKLHFEKIVDNSNISQKNAEVEVNLSDNSKQLIVFITYRYFSESEHRERIRCLRFLYTDEALFYHHRDLIAITSKQAIVNIINNFDFNNAIGCVDPLYQIYSNGCVMEKNIS